LDRCVFKWCVVFILNCQSIRISFKELDLFLLLRLNAIEAALGDENFDFSVVKSYLKLIVAINSNTVGFIENVADYLPLGEGMESKSSFDLAISVSESNQELSS
jgi:hypothetical protein